MKKVRVVTDSTADIPEAVALELGITIVPCLVFFGQQAYRDRVDLQPEEFYQRLASSSVLPHTSGPAVGDFVTSYRQLLKQESCEGIVSIHVAGKLSGTLNAAWAAAQELDQPSKLRIIDSQSVSMGMGWIVITAGRLARDGASLEEVDQAVQELLPQSRVAAMADTLENLRKGGRISQISAMLGTALRVKPLIAIERGQVDVWGKVRTRARALDRLEAMVRGWGPMAEVAVLHGAAEPQAQQFADRLADLVAGERMRVEAAVPALIAHLGLGAVGVCGLVNQID
jgi:DegV family protein with EDD domain